MKRIRNKQTHKCLSFPWFYFRESLSFDPWSQLILLAADCL
jgi:hypothetical protein